MKKYRTDERVIVYNHTRGEMVDTKVIVWVGSGKYWNRVYLHKLDNRLYINTGFGKYELLDTFNIREVGACSPT